MRLIIFIVWICVAIAACSSRNTSDAVVLHGEWNYDLSMTLRSFLNTRAAEANHSMVPPDLSDAYVRKVKDLGLRTTVTIDSDQIRTESPLGTERYSYRVVSVEGNTYALELTNDAGANKSISVRVLKEAIAIQSSSCEDDLAACDVRRKGLAKLLQVDLPALQKPSALQKDLEASVDVCAESDEQECGIKIDRSKVVPQWLYYTRRSSEEAADFVAADIASP